MLPPRMRKFNVDVNHSNKPHVDADIYLLTAESINMYLQQRDKIRRNYGLFKPGVDFMNKYAITSNELQYILNIISNRIDPTIRPKAPDSFNSIMDLAIFVQKEFR